MPEEPQYKRIHELPVEELVQMINDRFDTITEEDIEARLIPGLIFSNQTELILPGMKIRQTAATDQGLLQEIGSSSHETRMFTIEYTDGREPMVVVVKFLSDRQAINEATAYHRIEAHNQTQTNDTDRMRRLDLIGIFRTNVKDNYFLVTRAEPDLRSQDIINRGAGAEMLTMLENCRTTPFNYVLLDRLIKRITTYMMAGITQLDLANQLGIIHDDTSPKNFLSDQFNGHVTLIDYEYVKVTENYGDPVDAETALKKKENYVIEMYDYLYVVFTSWLAYRLRTDDLNNEEIKQMVENINHRFRDFLISIQDNLGLLKNYSGAFQEWDDVVNDFREMSEEEIALIEPELVNMILGGPGTTFRTESPHE